MPFYRSLTLPTLIFSSTIVFYSVKIVKLKKLVVLNFAIFQVTSTDCTVREPLFNNLFNLTDAHNSTGDYIIKGQSHNYNLNVCGSLVGTCTDTANSTCLDTNQSLTYMDGFLELKYESKVCPSNPNKTLDAR